jgi:ABC-type branched-subunit amino acid transport system substrate-binding protein
MRARRWCAIGLAAAALTACGSTAQQTSLATAPAQVGDGGLGDGSGGGAPAGVSAPGTSAPVAALPMTPAGPTVGPGPATSAPGVRPRTASVAPLSKVDYSKPATGSSVDVGIMYIEDLSAAAALFGGDGGAGLDQKRVMRRTVDWMNAHGGLGGHKINLVLYGAQIAGSKSYDQSLQEMCSMMTEDHHVVAAVIANITVPNNMAHCMEKAKGLYVTDGGYLKTSADWAGLTYTVSPSELDANLLGRQLAQLMLDKGAAKRGDTVGLVVYDAPGFHAAEQQFLRVAKDNGISVVSYAVHYATSTPDLANSITAVQSAQLAMQARGAKVVASLSSGGMMAMYLSNANQQKYFPRYLLSSNDSPVGGPAAAKPGQLKGALVLGTQPLSDVDLFANPRLFSDRAFATCRSIHQGDASIKKTTDFAIVQRVCQSLLLVQTAARGYGGTDITGTTLRNGLRQLRSTATGSTYLASFGPRKQWAPSHYRALRFDEAKNAFVYDGAPQPLR